jgi:hypothetical protein
MGECGLADAEAAEPAVMSGTRPPNSLLLFMWALIDAY